LVVPPPDRVPGFPCGQTGLWFGSRTVLTALPLTVLRPLYGTDRAADATEIDWLPPDYPVEDVELCHHWHDGDDIVLSLARQGADYWLRAPGIAVFLLQMQPSRIRVLPETDIDASTLEHVLVDQVLPRLLAQQGELMVHASALAIEGRHALFAGPSGWGKSTLAGLMHRQGHLVLSDDCMQLVAGGERLHALPTYSSLRLYDDSLQALFPGVQGTGPVASYSDKRRMPMGLPPDAEATFPVDALYVLGDPDEADGTIRMTPLRSAEACQALLRHSFRLDLGDRTANARQFALCGAAARTLPAFRLQYPRDFARSDELVQRIVDHLASLPPQD